MTENLKRCPFCGEEARVEKINLGKQGLFRVICPECLTATTHLREDEKNAVAEWNSRPIENELEAENKRLREALEFYALGKHLLKASGVVCDAYDIVSGKVENGKYAQEVLEGCAK